MFSTRRTRICALLLAAFIVASCGGPDPVLEQMLAENNRFDILISGGIVVDGSGAAGKSADVLVRADTIAYVGRVDSERVVAGEIIDAVGKVVTPGFIDPHAHGDPFETPRFSNFLAMGVTTITLGQDGGGPGGRDLAAWMRRVDSVGPSINVAVFAGHGALRRAAGIGNDVNPPAALVDSMAALLGMSLDAGAFGLSTGLEYTPGVYARESELRALANVVGRRGSVVMSHLRNEDDEALEASIRELLRQADPARVHVSHIKSVYGKGEARAEEILAVLDSARAAGVQVTADMYPYSASYTGIGIVFPLWARPPNDYREVVRERGDELAEYLRNRVTLRNGPDATLIGTGRFAGLTLAEVADELEKPFERVLMEDLGPDGASAAYFVMDDALQQRLAQSPIVMFSSDGSPTAFHPRGHGAFAKIIEDYVEGLDLLTLEEAIRKMTSFPAAVLGLDRRGLLAPGHFADILVFDPVRVRAVATYAEPHQTADGFDFVMVNGVVTLRRGAQATERSGRMLRYRR